MEPSPHMAQDATVSQADEEMYDYPAAGFYVNLEMQLWLNVWKDVPKITDIAIRPLRSELDKYPSLGAPKFHAPKVPRD
jgi:hypothetical protein